MSEMVDRIARVLDPDCWNERADRFMAAGRSDILGFRAVSQMKAADVLAAMREPVDAIIICDWEDGAADTWRAMIDAALKEG